MYLNHPKKPILEASLAEYLVLFFCLIFFFFLFLFFFSSFSFFFFFKLFFSDCKNPCKISKMREFSKNWSMSWRKLRGTISVCGIVCGRLHSTRTCGALVADLRVREIAELSCSQETTKPASSSAVRFHTCGTIINFDVQGSFPLAHSLALFLSAWPLTLSALVFARIGCFPVCWASNCFAAIAHQNNNRIAINDLGQPYAIVAAGLLLLPFVSEFLLKRFCNTHIWSIKCYLVFFGMVCAIYPNVGHKICMFIEKNDKNENKKLEEKINCDKNRKK